MNVVHKKDQQQNQRNSKIPNNQDTHFEPKKKEMKLKK
jgi:hypothetical protein